MTVRRALAIYLGLCLGLIALAANATSQPLVGTGLDQAAESLVRKWLLWALALANLVGAFVLVALPEGHRVRFLFRHAALYAIVPLTLLFLHFSPGVLTGQLGALYIGLVAAAALHLLHGIAVALRTTSDRIVAALLGVVALATFLAILPYHRTVQPTASDEPHYLLITQSLLYDNDLDLRNDYEGDRYLAFYPDRLPDMHGIEIGRAVYPIRDIGLPLASVVPFALAGRSGVLALVCAIGALLVAQLYLALRDMGFAPRVAFLATALAGFTHPLLTYTTQVYPELALALIFIVVSRLLRRGRAAASASLVLASALTALLPLLSTRAWLIALPLVACIGAFALLAPGGAALRARRTVLAALPFVAIVGALTVLNGALFGVYLPSAGYYIIRDQQQVLAYTPQVGAAGLLFDRAFGLVGRAPVYLLALLGAGALLLRRRTHGAQLAVLASGWLAYFLYVASIAYWWADGSPPSRYLLGSIPFAVAGVAGGLETLGAIGPKGLAAAATAPLAAASAFVTYVYAVLPNLGYDLALDLRARASSGQLWTYLGRVIRPEPGNVLPSLVVLDPPSIILAVVWTVIAIALVALGLRLASRSRPHGREAAKTARV